MTHRRRYPEPIHPSLPALAVALTVLIALLALAPAVAQSDGGQAVSVYKISGVFGVQTRSRIAATGADVFEVGHDYVLIGATPEETQTLRSFGFKLAELETPEEFLKVFPPADSKYHDYSEMVAELQQAAADHPAIFSLFSLGTSYEGRTVWAGKVSDQVGVDEDEPEVLLTHHQHAREHLTVEQALYTLKMLTDEYGRDPRITNLVNSREVWIVFDMNPDGSEYDIATGAYRVWRKNRQPNAGGTTGVDLNRNWGYRWGCCGGSSGATGSETYRGASPFSAPETAVVRDFVDSRVIGGVQQIRTHIDFHTYSELVLWPYGYTTDDVPPDMTRDDHEVFVAMGLAMAATNGYLPEQASDLYITDGSIDDWLYGVYRIFSFAFEMYPASAAQGGFYPPDEVIPAETARNREAILYLIEQAACPYATVGLEGRYCGDPEPVTIFADDFDGASTGWVIDPDGTDQATSGRWEIGDPAQTKANGVKQLGAAASGAQDLVTGRLAGRKPDSYDVDGGMTSVRSVPITLGGTYGKITLRFSAYLAHAVNSSAADSFRVKVIGSTTETVFEELGSKANDNGAWTVSTVDLTRFKGQTLRLQFECTDAARASLVECGVDSVQVLGTP
ncbi:MAG TPA: M14 family zinc carboxypeptidase [Thermoanaerobaculia bacterium]|jgi:hypothetical protein